VCDVLVPLRGRATAARVAARAWFLPVSGLAMRSPPPTFGTVTAYRVFAPGN